MAEGRRSEAGQTLLILAAALGLVLLGFLGLGIDMGYLRYVRRQMQAAADAAAIAGAMQTSYCASANCASLQTAAQNALTENGFASSTVVTNCSTSTASGVILTINNPPCNVATDPNKGNANYVEVIVSQSTPTLFARIFGVNSVSVATRAEAQGNLNCVYALDPSGTGVSQIFGAVNSPCGIVVESNNSFAALNCFLFSLNAPYIGVVGGDIFFCGGITQPRTGIKVPQPADPLAYLTKPTVGACGSSMGSPYTGAANHVNITSGIVTFNPGVYCGGITISRNSGTFPTVTFNPGTYILKSNISGGGLSVDLNTKVTGNGVTFYNFGPSGAVSFTNSCFLCSVQSVSLSAPTSGTYSGILFFQDPGNTSAASIVGSLGLNTKLEGVYYFPMATVTFAFSGTANYNGLVARDIQFNVSGFGSAFYNNYQALSNGSPIHQSTAVLVQ